MKTLYFVLCGLLLFLFSSFYANEACEYAGSNMGYIKTQTKKAISADNVNKSHFLAYRAINALEKSKNNMLDCGCSDADNLMKDALNNLKMATKATSINATRILLNRSLEYTLGSLQALEDHDEHDGPYGTDVLSLNTIDADRIVEIVNVFEEKSLNEKIDTSLLKYAASLDRIVETVNCKEAHAFATKIYEHCEQELLRKNLSEGKKYYNLRTKQITEDALAKLGDCSRTTSK